MGETDEFFVNSGGPFNDRTFREFVRTAGVDNELVNEPTTWYVLLVSPGYIQNILLSTVRPPFRRSLLGYEWFWSPVILPSCSSTMILQVNNFRRNIWECEFLFLDLAYVSSVSRFNTPIDLQLNN